MLHSDVHHSGRETALRIGRCERVFRHIRPRCQRARVINAGSILEQTTNPTK